MPGTSLLSSRRDRQFRRTNAREIVARLDDMGVEWRAELSDEQRATMETS
jgi:hypothetical protein